MALERVQGTGPGGAVTLEDIERARPAQETVPAAEPARPGKPADMRDAIAAAMSRAKREIPHYYLGHWIDLSPANEWLDFNGFWRDGAFVAGDGVHVGSAISLRRGGLVAPALKHADRCSLPELMDAFRDLVARTRAGRLTGSELAGGTITVSSLGEQGVEEVYPVIYPPQVAIVGFGTPVERPWVVEGRVEPRWLVRATLAADHRVSDGHRGALFLEAITRLLQEPDTL